MINAATQRTTIRAHLGAYTGYHVLTNSIFEFFTKRGIFVSLRPIAVDEQWGRSAALPLQMKAQIVHARQPEPCEILVAPPENTPTPGRKTVFFTMYESTEMPANFIRNLNQAALVIVPCKWNADCFKANGVKPPIIVCPLGFDPDIFKPTPIPADGPTVFGVAGRTKHCAKRKGVQEAIDLFLRTFPNDDDVRLHVKIHPDDKIDPVTDHRIKVTRDHLEPYQIAHWISGLTAYLTLARAEGYGLWQLQALASGRPVIGCKYSGTADFVSNENSFVIPHREIDAISGESNVSYLGQWADPNLKDAGKLLRQVYSNRTLVIDKGARAAKGVQNLTWEKSINKLIAILTKHGVLSK